MTVVAVTSSLGLIVLGAYLSAASTNDAASLSSTVAGLGGLVVSAWQLIVAVQHREGTDDPQRQSERAAQDLADLVRYQWERESEFRTLHQPEPLHVRWRTTSRPVAGDPEWVLAGSVGGRPLRLHFSGSLHDSVDKFYSLPRRQLVVLGQPGSGKTVFALLLTLGLIERRKAGEPVPVLLAMLTWNPAVEHLHVWLVRRIEEEYPQLRNEAVYGPAAAQRLVRDGRVLPILDGLDELAAPLRSAAIANIARAMGTRPLVVTCRSAEYVSAVRQGGVLGAAAVIELDPVRADDAFMFLRGGTPLDSQRWKPVMAYVTAHPSGPLTQALSSPLMVSLARVVYSTPGTNPAVLLDAERFPNRERLEKYLLDELVPTVYGADPVSPALNNAGRAYPRWDAARVQRWLAFLALHLQRQQTRDLAWWHLYRAVPRRPARYSFVAFVGVTAFLVGTGAIGLVLGWARGIVTGVAIGCACAVTAVLPVWFGNIPGQPVRLNVRWGRIGGAREGVRSVLSGALAPGLIVGVVATLATNGVIGTAAGVVAALVGGITVGLVRWSLPTDYATAISPASVLRADRRAVLTHAGAAALVLGTAIGLAFGQSQPLLPSLFLGAVGGASLAFGYTLGSAWAWYQVTRAWLALRGQVPVRLMTFLDDAHRRGVLRQAGAVYQFRHGRLQDRLTESAGGPADGPGQLDHRERLRLELSVLQDLLDIANGPDALTAITTRLDLFPDRELRTWRELERHKGMIKETLLSVGTPDDEGAAAQSPEARIRARLRAEVVRAIEQRTSAVDDSGRP